MTQNRRKLALELINHIFSSLFIKRYHFSYQSVCLQQLTFALEDKLNLFMQIKFIWLKVFAKLAAFRKNIWTLQLCVFEMGQKMYPKPEIWLLEEKT